MAYIVLRTFTVYCNMYTVHSTYYVLHVIIIGWVQHGGSKNSYKY